jgi:small subunit ribosomal protein S6
MTLPAPTYDLVLLLDPEADEATRAKIVADARTAIEKRGQCLRHGEWGNRALTYPIGRKSVAEYHLLQFHADTPELLAELERSLRIADDVLRFRIVKLKPGVPDAPEMLDASAARQRIEPQPAATATATATDTEIEPVAEMQAPAEAEAMADVEIREPA